MANLNFQQPPRSIANSSLSNRGGSIGAAFGGAVNSGHVTPTSGMFQQNNAGFGPPSQLSPNRSAVQLGGVFNQTLGGNVANTNQGRANLFGPRTMNDRRQMQNLGQMVMHSIFFGTFSDFTIFIRFVIVIVKHLFALITHFADIDGLIHAVKRLCRPK